MRTINSWIAFCLVLWGGGLSAQQSLTLNDAIGQALAHNLQIQVSRNQAEMATNNATYGNAGLLPTVSATGGAQYGINNTRLEIVSAPEPIETTGAESATFNAAIQANYTLFSGLAGWRNYEKLNVVADLSDAQSKVQVENLLMQVTNAYFDLLRLQQNEALLQENLKLSNDRLAQVELSFELSGGSKAEVLSAQVDLGKDSAEWVQIGQQIAQRTLQFNYLMGADLQSSWDLEYEFSKGELPSLEELQRQLTAQNNSLQQVKLNQQVSMLNYQIAQSGYMPKVNFSSAYAYNRTLNEGSFLTDNETVGFSAGLTLSVPIYTGGTRKMAVKNASIDMENKALQEKDVNRQLDQQLRTAYLQLESKLAMVDIQRRNLVNVKAHLAYVQEQFAQGLTTSLQLRQAQLNQLMIENSLAASQYNAELARLELARLTGTLVGE